MATIPDAIKLRVGGSDGVAAKPVHPEATALVQETVQRFEASLTRGAQSLAYAQGDEIILRRHVRHAEDLLRRADQRRAWLKDFFAPCFLGVGLSEIVRELIAPEPSKMLMAVFVILALVGLGVASPFARR